MTGVVFTALLRMFLVRNGSFILLFSMMVLYFFPVGGLQHYN